MAAKRNTLEDLRQLETTLVDDRDTINRLLRVVRTMIRHLEYGQAELRRAKGTKAFVVLKKAYNMHESMAQGILEQLEVPSDDIEASALAVPEMLTDDSFQTTGFASPAQISGEASVPSKRLHWSNVSRDVLRAAFSKSELPETWNDLMRAAYGPQWEQIPLADLPGTWERPPDKVVLADDIFSSDSRIYHTVLKGLTILESAIGSEQYPVTSDIRQVATLAKAFPDYQAKMDIWRMGPQTA